MTAVLDHAGFADPVFDSQACFRAVLNAMARPGTIHTVHAPTAPPPPLDRATAAVLLTLLDADTPLWLQPEAASVQDWLAFHTGAPTAEAARAAFGLALRPVALADFHAGSDDAPEAGATLVLQVAALGTGHAWRLSGPGLAAPCMQRIDGLVADFAAQWAANRRRFPRGIDLVLCAGDRLAALPRTVQIEEA